MKPKKLKKLELRTEQLVSLNDHEMRHLRGGNVGTAASTDRCYDYITLTIDITVTIYEYGENNTWWNCPPEASQVYENGACRIPTVDVYP